MEKTSTRIRLFTVPDCGRCEVVKTHLKARGLDYDEIRVDGNLRALREMVSRTGSRTVPVVFVGNDFVIGPDLRGIDRLVAALEDPK